MKSKRSKRFPVFASDDSRKVVHLTTIAEAEIFERREIWRREYNTISGVHIGFRVIGVEVKRVDMDLRPQQTPATLTKSEMETIAGCRGVSHTSRLHEHQRLERIRNGRPAEDRIERTMQKFRVYKQVGAAKGDILRAWSK